MFTVIDNYKAFSKIIVSDYPYKIKQYFDDRKVFESFDEVYGDLLQQHSKIKDIYYSSHAKGIIDLSFTDHFLILCHRLSFILSKKKKYIELANAIFYSAKIRTGCNIFYKVKIDKYFVPMHPFGTVISHHAKYGKGLQLYHNVTIGPYRLEDPVRSSFLGPAKRKTLLKIGNWVIILAHTKIMGKSTIGDNVILGAGTTIIDKNVPSNTTVINSEKGDTVFMPNKNNNKKKFFML